MNIILCTHPKVTPFMHLKSATFSPWLLTIGRWRTGSRMMGWRGEGWEASNELMMHSKTQHSGRVAVPSCLDAGYSEWQMAMQWPLSTQGNPGPLSPSRQRYPQLSQTPVYFASFDKRLRHFQLMILCWSFGLGASQPSPRHYSLRSFLLHSPN